MQAYHKAEKQKALKRAKTEKAKLRTEKLARKNPDRMQRQVDDLKALEASGDIKPFEKKLLGELEAELKAVKKAREVLGIKEEEKKQRGGTGADGVAGRGRGGAGVAGVGAGEDRRGRGRGRGRGGLMVGSSRQLTSGQEKEEESDSGESTSSSVRNIPMPSGTPPPLPLPLKTPPPPPPPQQLPRQPHALPPKPVMPTPVTTYSAAPIVRDLRKEAAAFVPAAVQRKVLDKRKEREISTEEGKGESHTQQEGSFSKRVMVNAAPDVGESVVVDDEYERFRREMELEEEEEEEE